MADQSERKKVLVSGCFDLLHSGHVEFFREAAQYGDLYVRLGTCANIKALKNHLTMYNDEERLFMVKNIGCVHDAALSTGTGVYDFESDMKVIKPDIYFVNEDASKMEGRVKICKNLGIKMVMKPRKPFQGLEARSSTSMKARLREMVKREEADEMKKESAQGIEAYHNIIPWRLCFAGGWMDLKWCNELYHGCVVTINIKFNKGICKDRCGLATSSRKTAIKLWNGQVPSYMSAYDAAKYLWAAENFDAFGSEDKPYIAGSQDTCGLMFPGINKLSYAGKHWPSKIVNLNDTKDVKQAAVFKWLESVLHIVEIPFKSRPENYNSQGINNLKDERVPTEDKVRMVAALANASESAWNAIVAMDATKLGKALSNTMKAWNAMLPFTVNPYIGDEAMTKALKDFYGQYDIPNTKGCLFSGAGGGFLMVINEKPVKNGMKIEINHDHYCQPFESDKL